MDKTSIYDHFSIVKNSIFLTFSKLDLMMKNQFLGMKNGFPEPPGPSPTPKNPERGPKTLKHVKNPKFEVGDLARCLFIHITYYGLVWKLFLGVCEI